MHVALICLLIQTQQAQFGVVVVTCTVIVVEMVEVSIDVVVGMITVVVDAVLIPNRPNL